MNIGELASTTDTKAETIRYYERIGLLPEPPCTAGNYRDYSIQHVSRLTFIRCARDLGFSIDQIWTLLDLADQKERSCEAVDTIAREHLADVKRKLADLTALRRELDYSSGNAVTAQLLSAAFWKPSLPMCAEMHKLSRLCENAIAARHHETFDLHRDIAGTNDSEHGAAWSNKVAGCRRGTEFSHSLQEFRSKYSY